jgi:kumamolisin
MPNEPLVPLPGSERAPLPSAEDAGPVDTSARAELTLVLRRRAPGALGAADEDIERVSSVLTGLGLSVTEVHPASRRIKVAGTIGELSEAFGTSVRLVHSHGVRHRYREGALYLPQSLDGTIEAVLGLDDRPQARAHFRAAAAAPAGSFTPAQVASFYRFPSGTDGTGQIVALVELGGGFTQSDLSSYFSGLGLATPTVTAVSVDGAGNAPGSAADTEVALDIDVVGAAAPGATQLVYFAPNTDQGFVDAVSDAAHASPTPVAISISWGQSEDAWTAQGRTAMDGAIADACALGVTVCVAAGDNGSSDGATDGSVHCDFPASSPHALACGGTRLVASGMGAISSETVWNNGPGGGAGGGGVSDTFPEPSWQANAGVPPIAHATAAVSGAAAGTGAAAASSAAAVTDEAHHRRHGTGSGPGSGAGGRGVPDVAGNADPQTGYQIMCNGKGQLVGGTSAVAPLWAALIARLAQATGTRFGLIQPALYAGIAPGADVAGFNDVVSGSNGAYSAGPGWDACTGLGSPDGTALLARLRG